MNIYSLVSSLYRLMNSDSLVGDLYEVIAAIECLHYRLYRVCGMIFEINTELGS